MKRQQLTLAAVLFGALASGAIAQDEKPEKPPIRPDLGDVLPGAERSPKDEMTELFQKVEGRLTEMGRFLVDASAGDTQALKEVGASGIEELLELAQPGRTATGGVSDLLAASSGHGKQALEEIDRILEIARENGGT